MTDGARIVHHLLRQVQSRRDDWISKRRSARRQCITRSPFRPSKWLAQFMAQSQNLKFQFLLSKSTKSPLGRPQSGLCSSTKIKMMESWPMTRNQPKMQASDKTKTRPHASEIPPRSFPMPAFTRKSDLEGVIPTDLGISRKPIFHSRNHHKLPKNN